jgi:hypothetical protein
MKTSPESDPLLKSITSSPPQEVDAKPKPPLQSIKPPSQSQLKKQSANTPLERSLPHVRLRKRDYSYKALTFLLLSVGSMGAIVFAWKGLQPVVASLRQPLVHPVSIPWLQSQDDCERTGRTWNNNECWDHDHSPHF